MPRYSSLELNVQYNPRTTVADITPFLADYTRLSEVARQSTHVLNFKFGSHPDETLDVFLPQNSTLQAAPIFVYLHGGYWRLLSKDESCFMAPTFTAAGACVVVVNYSLAPAVGLTKIVQQCQHALAFCYQHAHEWGANKNQIYVGGSSAGGHLAAAMAMPKWPQILGLPSNLIKGIAPLSGLFDLQPVAQSNVNDWMSLTTEEITQLSPQQHLPSAPIPMVLAYAPNETDEFKRQSNDYLQAWQAQGYAAELCVPEHTNHFDLPLKWCEPQHPLTLTTLKMMGL